MRKCKLYASPKSPVRNLKIAKNVNDMFAKHPPCASKVTKKEPDSRSLSTMKLLFRAHRGVVRTRRDEIIRRGMEQKRQAEEQSA